MVGKCNNYKRHTNSDGKLPLRNFPHRRLWQCESDGQYNGECYTCLCSWYGIVNANTDGKYGIDAEYYAYDDECHGHR